ncbi:hypothetical protein O9X98_14850 [Agrobacterium salinitolerans]|nr:hypothetical protein [Agrobacterium salinitolerans]
MARPGYIDGVEDMMADAERLDSADRMRINLVQRDSIRMLFSKYSFSAEDIADYLQIELNQVQKILSE